MTRIFLALALILGVSVLDAFATSHAEAPFISMDRFADNTDIYAFRLCGRAQFNGFRRNRFGKNVQSRYLVFKPNGNFAYLTLETENLMICHTIRTQIEKGYL